VRQYFDPTSWEKAFLWGMMFITPADWEMLIINRWLDDFDSLLELNVRYNGPRRYIVPYSETEAENEMTIACLEGREPEFDFVCEEEFRFYEEMEAAESGVPVYDIWLTVKL